MESFVRSDCDGARRRRVDRGSSPIAVDAGLHFGDDRGCRRVSVVDYDFDRDRSAMTRFCERMAWLADRVRCRAYEFYVECSM